MKYRIKCVDQYVDKKYYPQFKRSFYWFWENFYDFLGDEISFPSLKECKDYLDAITAEGQTIITYYDYP